MRTHEGRPRDAYLYFSEKFGFSVAGAGDVNGDGYDDVIVGAPGSDAGGFVCGRAVVYSGRTGDTLHVFTGDSAADGEYAQLGMAVAGAGDINEDGFADLIVGAPLRFAGGWANGIVYVYSGRDGTVLHRFTEGGTRDQFGLSVANAGDVNQDGSDDILVGSPGAGRAFVYSGADGVTLHEFAGEVHRDEFGWSVSGAGDVDADGVPDVIVGAVRYDAVIDDPGRKGLRLFRPHGSAVARILRAFHLRLVRDLGGRHRGCQP